MVLNYALTLEQLENPFDHDDLAKFPQQDFTNAGFPDWARGRIEQIGQHEAAHVAFLSAALGHQATQPCRYNISYTDPRSLIALSSILEGVGVGVAQNITNKEYLIAGTAVLTTEPRHQAWVDYSPSSESLVLSTLLSLLTPHTLSQPRSSPAIHRQILHSFPFISPQPGQSAAVTAASGVTTEGNYVAFFSGLAQQWYRDDSI